MPDITTKFVDGSNDIGGKGLVTKDYIIDVYPNLAPGVKTPALWMWGNGGSGAMGDNTVVSKSSPVQTVTGGLNWKQASSGNSYTLAIKTDGTLWGWGANFLGFLGDGTTNSTSSPIQTIAGGNTWDKVSAGGIHAASIKTDGTLWLWGSGGSGQLGVTAGNYSSPIQTVIGGTNWIQVSCGYKVTAAIKSDGTLWAWGLNSSGELGDNTIVNRSSPVQTITGGSTWRSVSVGLAAGAGTASTVAAIKTDGTLWLWGLGTSGQLGDNTIVTKSSPVQTIAGGSTWRSVSVGANHCAAIKTDGTLWSWGGNGNGRLGDNTTTGRSSPVQTVAGGSAWKSLSCGGGYTAAIKTDGSLWSWGYNNYANLGDNTTTHKSSPVQTVMRGNFWKSVSASAQSGSPGHTAAIADGNY
jgi:alpha-tubulin suppressor-like RCC1 family protein